MDDERRARLHLALSKLCEHRLRDHARALEHARETAATEGSAARDHRVARIEAKLAKLAKRAKQRPIDVS
ncbi:MAG: hypothetical protein M5U28_11005 [Sandaracinaceae bacterium]|nr:hypothetical protein [Sandaracinaceae bacterium]